jgi:hypothetical protein
MIRHKRVGDGPAQSSEPPETLASKNCTELSYRLALPADKFKVDKFSEAIGGVVVSGDWNSVLLVPRNPQENDYHVHVFWEPDDADPSKTKLQVDYHVWPPEDEKQEHHVFAEDFFDWAREYIAGESANAHVHAEFEYSTEKWQSRILALPIKVPFDGKTAAIEGFSINLPSVPEGVNQVWVVWDKKKLKLQLFADRVIYFKGFAPHSDADALNTVVKKLIGETIV